MRPGKPRESIAETRFAAWVRRVGGQTRKLNGTGNRDWPDRLVVKPGTPLFFMEFKREGEKPRRSQIHFFCTLVRAGAAVFVCDTFEQAALIYRDWQPDVRAARLPADRDRAPRPRSVRRSSHGPRPR